MIYDPNDEDDEDDDRDDWDYDLNGDPEDDDDDGYYEEFDGAYDQEFCDMKPGRWWAWQRRRERDSKRQQIRWRRWLEQTNKLRATSRAAIDDQPF